MLLSTPAMVSFTRASGSLMLQLELISQSFEPLVQLVMKKGPSMARITSTVEMELASLASA